jgi:amino acid transporter
VFSLASLAFFAVAGSPAGSEDSIVAGGALVALAGFAILPIVWSVPEALVTAELATAFPTNGGFVVWVAVAFGETAGYMEGTLKWLAGVLDNAVYPIMMLNYLRKVVPLLRGDLAGRVFMAGTTLVLAWAQYLGLEIVGVTSNIVIMLTMMPFVVLVCMGMPSMKWDLLVAEKPDGNIQWGLLLQNLFWSVNYWDSISTLASEVKDPSRTFPRALALALTFTVAMYLIVLGVAIGNTPDDVTWDNAELADAGIWVAGEWLRDWIVVSVSVSAIGLFLAEVSTDIYQLDGMAEMGMLPKVTLPPE